MERIFFIVFFVFCEKKVGKCFFEITKCCNCNVFMFFVENFQYSKKVNVRWLADLWRWVVFSKKELEVYYCGVTFIFKFSFSNCFSIFWTHIFEKIKYLKFEKRCTRTSDLHGEIEVPQQKKVSKFKTFCWQK